MLIYTEVKVYSPQYFFRGHNMYNVFIPIMNKPMNERDGRDLVKQIKAAGADAVFLIFDRILVNDEELCAKKRLFMENKAFFEKNGIKVNAWLCPTIGYGGTGAPSPADNWPNGFTKIKFSDGAEVFAYCPLDEKFVDNFIKVIKAVAETGVEIILFEDDFTLSGGKKLSDIGCSCDLHMKRLREMTGENIEASSLRELLLTGGRNKYRDAWSALQGSTLSDFAKKIEAAAHEVNPDVRIGLSANSTSYELEGIAFPELVKIIASKNRPFARLTGAPYWKNALTQGANIEAIRLQTAWFSVDTQTVSEGDTMPRPRYWIPSAYLECYDMIIRASGGTEGILKYMCDYNSSARYEPGYVERHAKNAPHYAEIERRFSGKRAVGLNIFENMNLFADREFSEGINLSVLGDRNGYLPTVSQWLTADNSIPTAYGEKGCASLVFGENAKHVTDEMLSSGVVIDALAARYLMKRGVDIGAKAYAREKNPALEYYVEDDEFTATGLEREGTFYRFDLKEGAEVLSLFAHADESIASADTSKVNKEKMFPACWYYENSLGQRFMIYSFVAQTVWVVDGWHNGLFRNYCRQRQLAKGICRLQGRALPAMCFGNPELYILCKRDDNSMSVGLWNIFPDEVIDPVIHLDGEYKKSDFYNTTGHIEGNKVCLEQNIAPYGFAFFTVYNN